MFKLNRRPKIAGLELLSKLCDAYFFQTYKTAILHQITISLSLSAMLKHLKQILEGTAPDATKLKEIGAFVDRLYSHEDYKALLFAAKGPQAAFSKHLGKMDTEVMIGLLRASELDPAEYEHLDSSTDPATLTEFIEAHRDYLNFDFGGHFESSSPIGTKVFNLDKRDKTGTALQEVKPSSAIKVGQLLGMFENFETVYVLASKIQPRQTVTAMIQGQAVRCKTVRQPNPFQWAVEFQDQGKRRVEFVEIRDITPTATV